MSISVYVSVDFPVFPGHDGMNYWLEVGRADSLSNAARVGINYMLRGDINDEENGFSHRVDMNSLHYYGVDINDTDPDSEGFYVVRFEADVE